LLKLIKCEFLKLKRKPLVFISLLLSVFMPLAYAFFLADVNTDVDAVNGVMSSLFQLSAYLLLMPLLVILASNLLFEELDNDTLKNLVTVPVNRTKLVLSKMLVLLLFAVGFMAVGGLVKKQQALMDGVVLEESTLPEASVDADNENIQYRMETGDGCALSKGAIRVTKEGAQLKLVFHGLTDSENYLIADNLDYDSLSPRELIGNSQWKKMSEYDKNKVLDEDSRWRYWKESKEAAMTVSSNDVTKTIKIFTDKYNAYSGRHDFLCNMGYSRSGVRTMTITFANTGVYTYDKLRVVSQPAQGIEEKTVKLGEEALENVKMGTNEITGDISVSEKKALVLSVPYSKGFTAYVDGKETKLQKANTMFMALELEPGSHEIRLTYCTPYLKAGMLLSVLGLVIYVMLVFRKKK